MSFDPITYAAIMQLKKVMGDIQTQSGSSTDVGHGVKIGSSLTIVTDLQGRKFLRSGFLLPHSQVPEISEDMCARSIGEWTKRTISTGTYYSVTSHDGLLVAVGSSSVCATSPDGINWTKRTISTGTYQSVTSHDRLLVAVGNGSVCATSSIILLAGFENYSEYLYMRIL